MDSHEKPPLLKNESESKSKTIIATGGMAGKFTSDRNPESN